jgi:hypothetical protein
MPTLTSINGEGMDDEEEQLFGTMAWSTRIYGFLLFAILGLFASCLAWVALSTGNYSKYAVLTTMGNVMSLSSTCLLMGPLKQCKSMFDPVRFVATTVYLTSMVATLVAGCVIKSTALCALCSVVQYGALAWYSLSYIPYGREMALSCLKSCSRTVIAV